MTAVDLAVLAIYALLVTGVGLAFYRRAGTAEGFMTANRRLPGWVVGLSIFGTYLSSITFLALPGKAYASNWTILAFALSMPVAAWIAARWFIALYRSTPDVSAYAYLERRFGLWARLYASGFFLLTQVARTGTILFLVALTMQPLTGWSLANIILVTGMLVTLYTVVGGIEAVIWTDAVQSLVLIAGAVITVFIILLGMPAGAGQVYEIAAAHDKFSLGSFSPDFTQATFWVVLMLGFLINLQSFGIDQSYVQRYQAARSLPAARRSIWVGALLFIPVGVVFLLIGTALFAFYTVFPDRLPEALQAADAADRVYPHFIVTEFPTGIRGLVIAALFAAAMSSIDTSINSSATILMSDYYLRLFRRSAGERDQMRILRISTVVLGVAGTGAALLMISIKSTLDAWWGLASLFSGGMVGLFLLGVLSRRAAGTEAAIAMVTGLLVLAWAALSPRLGLGWSNPLHPFMTITVGTLSLFLVGIVLSRHRARRAPATPPQTIHDLQR